MSITDEEFNQILQNWKIDNTMPWGKLRYAHSRRNIARHIEKKRLRILDIGGGDGMDSIHYAKQGHSVTLFDNSDKMLHEARESAKEQGVDERLMICHAETDEILNLLDKQRFDLILCHMIIEFVSDAQVLLHDMCNLLSSVGVLSILDTNRYSDVYFQAFQMNSLSNANKIVGAKTYFHPWVNRPTPRFSADVFIDKLEENGCVLVGHYGVLNISAYLPNEPKFDSQYFAELEELEYRLADTYPYYLLARFFQVIAKKTK